MPRAKRLYVKEYPMYFSRHYVPINICTERNGVVGTIKRPTYCSWFRVEIPGTFFTYRRRLTRLATKKNTNRQFYSIAEARDYAVWICKELKL